MGKSMGKVGIVLVQMLPPVHCLVLELEGSLPHLSLALEVRRVWQSVLQTVMPQPALT